MIRCIILKNNILKNNILNRFYNNYNPLVETEKKYFNINLKMNIEENICKNIKNNALLETEKKIDYICNNKCKNLRDCKNIIDNPLK